MAPLSSERWTICTTDCFRTSPRAGSWANGWVDRRSRSQSAEKGHMQSARQTPNWLRPGQHASAPRPLFASRFGRPRFGLGEAGCSRFSTQETRKLGTLAASASRSASGLENARRAARAWRVQKEKRPGHAPRSTMFTLKMTTAASRYPPGGGLKHCPPRQPRPAL
jgi:hypothetical protein